MERMTIEENQCKYARSDVEKIWVGFGILFVAALIGLYGIVYALDHRLPTPLELKDEAEYPDAFIAERARNYHKPLVDIGPKVVGSDANEILAVNYILSVLKDIKDQGNSAQNIEIDLQIVSDNWYPRIYANLQNIVVKVHSATNTEHSILINTHFDTVPTSPGGSDDGINVAVALEALKKISQSVVKPRNNIIFLFNGAEEMGLLGSHGFITQHKWRNEVKVLINLEATGAGGREILFQTGPGQPWLLKYYDVPHPHANAAGEEIFQSGIIPSDTDFRIFRIYGDVVGYDFAFARDGYRYHTKFDGYDNIELGTYQHTGDNLLHLVRNLADAPEVANIAENDEKTVFFDFIGLFYIHYTANVGAVVINVITIVISILIIIWTFISYRIGLKDSLVCMPMMLIQLLGIVISCGLALLVSVILDAANSTMSWYRFPAMIFGLYIAPTILCQLLALMAFQHLEKRVLWFSTSHKKLTLCQKVVLQLHINRFLWTIVLLIGTIIKTRTVYIIMIPVLFNAVGMSVIILSKLHQRHGAVWFSVYVIFSLLPTMKLMYFGHEFLALFLPIMGRFGHQTNPEVLVGLLTVIITIKVTSYFTPLILFIRKPWPILMLISAVFLAAFVLAVTPFGFPYQFSVNEPRAQRYSVTHIQRILTTQGGDTSTDVGFHLNKNDRNSPNALKNHVTLLQEAYSDDLLLTDCAKFIGCGFPGYDAESSVWIPSAKPPMFPTALKYSCVKDYEYENINSYHCSIQGSDRLIVYISVRNGIDLISNSLTIWPPEYSFVWRDQLTFSIRFISGKEAVPLEFSFQIRKNVDVSGVVVDLAINAEYIHEDLNNKTEEFENFLAEFPDWTVVQTRLVHYEMIELT